MLSGNPTVSIVMPAFNVERHLARSVESVRAQTWQSWELIVIDDCSTDQTVEELKRWSSLDSRIRWLQQPANRGPSEARNRGFQVSRGEYIALLDADDAWHPERLTKLVELARLKNADIVADNLLFFDDHAERITGTACDVSDEVVRLHLEDVVESERPGKRFRFGFLKPIFRTSFLRKHGLEYWPKVRLAEDFLLLCEALLDGAEAYFSRWPGYIYTTQVGEHSGVRSSGTRTAQRYEDRVRIAERILRHPHAGKGTDRYKLLKRYRRWMNESWTIIRISQLREHSNILAAGYAVARPRAALRYLVESSLFKAARSRISY